MASPDEYTMLLPEFSVIPDPLVRTPTLPVRHYLHEAESLLNSAEQDRAKLEEIGLDWTQAESLPARAGALRIAEAQWLMAGNTSPEVQRQWKEAEEEGLEMRDDLLGGMRFAFRRHPEILTRVALVSDGNTQVDLVQDLTELAVLGKNHLALLEPIGITVTELDAAIKKSDLLADLLAARDTDNSGDPFKKLRDQAFTYLQQAVDEIRAYGRYISRKDRKRAEGYTSQYRPRRTTAPEPGPAPVA